MTQKRFVSMIGALVVILGAVAFITGCPQANSNKDNTTVNNGGNNTGNTGENTGGNTGSSTATQGRAVYVARIENGGVTYANTITFETDGTYLYRIVAKNVDSVSMQGTYTGNPSKDGTITVTIKKAHNGTALVDYTGANATQSITISGGKFTLTGIQFIRQ